MRIWLRATDKRGLTVPWWYVRSKLAEAWGCTPRLVDEEPASEIALQLRLWQIEAEACPPAARPARA